MHLPQSPLCPASDLAHRISVALSEFVCTVCDVTP